MTETEFAHVVLTRFNVRLNDLANPRGISDEWLTKRMDLFGTYCYPSLYHQTNQNFKWLLLLDSRSPDWLKERMADYSRWPNVVPVYLDVAAPESGGCPAELKAAINAHVPPSTTHLITTRVDNDDAISKDYIQRVQDCLPTKEAQGIVFPIGYQFVDGHLHLELSSGNHFISLIESYRPNDFMTVFATHHSCLYRVVPVRQVWARPTWLEVVHGGNLANHARQGMIVGSGDFQKRFAAHLIPFLPVDAKSLLMQQVKFVTIGAPQYLFKKLVNRIKYHGLFRRNWTS